ncbi:hypothetical protein SAMN06264364_101102 [Quadrisphaera granulorum]|uniref:Uncharacterized protein n=1 Tax=Quadrisphaera granulorum TaxID=317664 RepID=A0A316B0V6_9ACTN|nr:hypothetical protein [Quadrisphaera granulorum]PWJ56127.1 hypothetical protein BXY45_101102 [Quadrisphaera granulorum]SZE94761.1 hypothetical protein SAMN06264364_101102 [Quadrisphaera granulorum]
MSVLLLLGPLTGLGPSPIPGGDDLPRGLQDTDITPGVQGFLATAVVVVVSIFLIVNLVGRMRRIRHRAFLEEAAERAREEAARGRELDGTARGDGGNEPRDELAAGPDVVQGEVSRETTTDRDEPDTPRRPPA